MKKTFLHFFALAAVCACSKTTVSPDPSQIVFTAGGDGIDACVETTKTTVVTGLSSFNVLCFTGDETKASATQVWNASFSGSNSFKGGKYWPAVDEHYHFYASNVALSFNASGSFLDKSVAVTSRDVIVAKCLSPTFKASNPLEFKHVFSRIGTCRILPPSGFAASNISDLCVVITPRISGKYVLGSAEWKETSDGSQTTLASALSSSTDNDLWLLPGNYELLVIWTFSQGNFTKTYSRTATVSLTEGMVNNISATLPGPADDLQEVAFTVSVAEWKNQNVNANWNAE